jgi:hypothetical protein
MPNTRKVFDLSLTVANVLLFIFAAYFNGTGFVLAKV